VRGISLIRGRDGSNPTDRQINELLGKTQIENSKMTATLGM